MSRARLSKVVVLCCALAAITAGSAAGDGALVKVNGLVLRADGALQPRVLPRQHFAPIEFQGYFDVSASGGGQPPALEQVVIDFDRDGRLSAGGLPVCQPEQVASAGPAEARRTCAGAIVGSGSIEALVAGGGGLVAVSSALTLFNGPAVNGQPSVVMHANLTGPGTQTLALVVPIERRRGPFRYRTSVNFPPIAGGAGSVTHVDVEIGRRFKVGGQRRSYVSARCSDGILHTHGRFTFADGTIIDGSVEKACTAR